MIKVTVLIEGYTSTDVPDETACSTVSLIEDKDLIMVVDLGTLKSQQLLINALKKEGLKIDDVNMVCITHSHMDHYRNIGMFARAKALDYWGLWDGDKVVDWKTPLTENIEIIKTPGHNYDGITLLVKTDQGVIAICGDIFWKEDYPKEDPYASDPEKLKESREKILELADWVIPGHGEMFKVEK
ncbi:MAG: MBL fold metallo-hydrolase [Candidatus Daviesbacteria bacterium]